MKEKLAHVPIHIWELGNRSLGDSLSHNKANINRNIRINKIYNHGEKTYCTEL